MTLTELRYITALARERHFGRAADRCSVSQPTLSVAVKKLEDELGVALFERNKQEIAVTPVGERVVEQAKRVLTEADQVKRIAKQGQDQLDGPLRLGAIFTIGPYLIPHLLPILNEQAPQMPLLIEESYTATLAEALKAGQLDLIIISLPFNEPGIVTLPIYREPFAAVLPSSHPWREQERLELRQMSAEPLLLLGPGHCFRDQVLEFCPECRQSPTGNDLQRTLEGSSLETIRHMVASGLGITILPCTAAGADRYAQRLLTIRRFQPPEPSRRVALAWRATFPRPKAVEAVRRAMRATRMTCVELL